MKRKLMATFLALVAGTAFAAGNPIYLKADATGEGTGDNWANALTSVDDAIALADSTGRPVYAAGGFYLLGSSHTLASGLEFHGGFPGVSDYETTDDCDSSTYETIVSPVAAGSLKWNHAVPDADALTIAVSALDAVLYPVLATAAGGRTAFCPPPAYTAAYDSYYISGGKNLFFAYAADGMTLSVSGVWFVGFSSYPIKVYSCAAATLNVRTISDCRFYGGQGVWEQNNPGVPDKDQLVARISDCEFRYTYNLAPIVQTYDYGTLIENCVFSDHARTSVQDGGELIWCWYRYTTIRGSAFRRATAISNSTGEGNANYSACNLIGWNAASRVVIEDCTMEENLTMSQYG